MAPSRGEEHDARGTIRLYNDTTREDTTKFGDLLESVRTPAQQKLKIADRVAAYRAARWIRSFALASVTRNVADGRRIIAMFACVVHVYPRKSIQRMKILPKAHSREFHNQYKPCGLFSIS